MRRLNNKRIVFINVDKKWMKEKITISYEDMFNYVVQSNILGEFLNENKLAEVGFEIPHLVYIQRNNKSPYINDMKNSKEIKYIKGDATNPIGEGRKYIVHICNDIGGWGRGFVLALSNKWAEPEKRYREWFRDGVNNYGEAPELGNVQFVQVLKDITVCNMIAQHGCYPSKDVNGIIVPPIRYEALEKCLDKVCENALQLGVSVHMPLIGAGLAGGDWTIIESIIKKTLSDKGVDVIVYLFDE